MSGRQAKLLSDRDIRKLIDAARDSRFPIRNELIVLLATRAAMRASEIAGLTWDMVLDGNGMVASTIDVRDSIAKRGAGRRIPMHPNIKKALRALKRLQPHRSFGFEAPVVRSNKGGHLQPNSIVNWFREACQDAGLEGCSSHSGRRTFITNAARTAHRAGAGLRDVQMLAGHRSIETTQRYIDGDSDAQRRLVSYM